MLFQVEIQVIALAVLQDCAEPAPKQERAVLPPHASKSRQVKALNTEKVCALVQNLQNLHKRQHTYWNTLICSKENDLRVSVK